MPETAAAALSSSILASSRPKGAAHIAQIAIRQKTPAVFLITEAAASIVAAESERIPPTTGSSVEIADFAAFNAVYAKYFTSKPARSCVAVKDLPKGALCEIECIAQL